MKKLIFVLLFYLINVPVYAKSSIDVGYRYFVADQDYSSTFVQFGHEQRGHRVFFGYERMDGRSLYDMDLPSPHSEYDPLQRIGLMYMYFGDKHMWGGGIMSAGDKPFNTFENTGMFAFYGYCIYSKNVGITKFPLPDGSVFEHTRRARLFIGVGATKDPIAFGQHFIPVFSYVYEGEKILLSLGLPYTAIVFRPSQQHKFQLGGGFQGNTSASYEFSPTRQNTIKLEFTQNTHRYKVSDAPKADTRGGATQEIHFQEQWIRLGYEHRIKMVELNTWIGYMPEGHYFYGKYFHTNSSRKIESTMEYGMSVKMMF